MTTIKEIQELATQADDWTKRKVAEKLLEAIDEWQLYSARLDKAYLGLHKWFTFIVDSYPKYPDDALRSVADAVSIVNAMDRQLNLLEEYSEGAKAHAKRIDEYLTFLSIYGDDEDQLRKEINENKIKGDN